MLNCRICNLQLDSPFLSLGKSPVSNTFLSKENLTKMEPYYPLMVYICSSCYFAQIGEFEKAENIFSSNYAYFSSYSTSWLEHCRNYTNDVIDKFQLSKNTLVMEIASNDGYLLQYFKEKGMKILGVEPASNVAEVAIKKGIHTDITFFNTEYAQKMTKNGIFVDLLIGNNVLAHNPNLNDFVRGMKIILNSKGLITLEFPHLLNLLKFNQFDTIYHEHFNYFSLYSVIQLFKKFHLEIFDVEELTTHGGSIRIYGKHFEDSSKQINDRIDSLLEKEREFGLFNLDTYHDFEKQVHLTKRTILNFLIQEKNKGKNIVAYGAPAKGNTLLNFCGIRTDFIDYTVDLNTNKQNKFLPGTNIPIYHPDKISETKPDFIIILPWNIKDEIMQQLSYIREWGGKFIIPIPKVEVL